jgi:hypothetical protein
MTNIPEESKTKTSIRLCKGIWRVHRSGTGMARRNASVAALKQLIAMKKADEAVQSLSGSGCTLNLREYGKHIKLSISIVATKPHMHSTMVNLSTLCCQEPNARRW